MIEWYLRMRDRYWLRRPDVDTRILAALSSTDWRSAYELTVRADCLFLQLRPRLADLLADRKVQRELRPYTDDDGDAGEEYVYRLVAQQ